MTLRLFSSLGNETREFKPLVPGEARIYVCGVTPYDVTHLGHAFSYVQFDALRRYLHAKGFAVRYVQNVTDIDDDMIMVSKREGGRPIAEIRDENDAIFRNDLDRLNVLRPTVYPRATDHIPQIIESTREIVAQGCGYEVDGDVFFEAGKFPGYGKLNGVTIAELAKRENPESKREWKKRGPLDFLLWQRTEPDEPRWDSPWGPGRPGWSIECTAMSTTHLGPQIDIHGGGRDLIFPHHENEIAQAECMTGLVPFTGYWMHNGMLQLEGVKMSKSLGNLVLARNLMSEVDPDHLRLYLLNHHYRTDADYHTYALPALGGMYERLSTAAQAATGSPPAGSALRRAFEDAMDNDLDTPAALALLDEAAQRVLNGTAADDEAAALRECLAILGFAFAGARGPATGHLEPGP
ncbi:MAG: cysteine--tRNA ligase [Dehalococcoidia bacterium]|nr:cysteine--tRNA ligase [Dehalococcoidia bacterium]